MMADKRLFDKIESVEPRTIALGDGNRIRAERMGTVTIPTLEHEHERKLLVLKRVLYIPDLDTNLVSCAALDMDGYTTHFGDGRCEIRLGNEVMCIGKLKGGLYVMQISPSRDSELVVIDHSKSGEELWHRRFGHVYKRTLKDMATRGTQARLTLKSRSHKESGPGDVIFTDVCGPLPVKSLSGKVYFITKFDCKVKLLYSDNGGEYQGLVEYLEKQGIEWEPSAPYTPQQNGVAERLNRTLM
ncbi:unnamed protein product [Chondrus crispus]|uniref:Integrase catalytic domain-containing protein n=1 Tax=Chondrus crispus TaxID=2769 RepID=R7QL37_CHOCR|nr:unnamed protein product [Chondrus crispus]CDF38468.1 unnamed protein product [Chondrus crispus]|eukprot:XP_005718361.1 unnamed protein product [Chondrus crispus]